MAQTPTKQFMQFWKVANVMVGVAVLLFTFSVFPARTKADFEEGRQAYNKGDYVIAAEEFRNLADPGIVRESDNSKSVIEGIWDDFIGFLPWAWEKISGSARPRNGHAPAQLYLGMMYALGRGVPQDYAEAFKWFSLAAEQGNAQAQYALGSMYYEGRGVPQVYSEAFKWFSLAAEQGDAAAQNSLASMYIDGKAVPQDYAEALKWVRMAAEQGHAAAQNSLGMMYFNGQGVAKDYVQAHMWYNLAAAQGHDAAKNSRGIAEKLMSRNQIEGAQQLATEWMEKQFKKSTGER